ncbi:MAG: hypothetical protein Q9168_005216 [Polycauliona sp. 1 TL-2023]
MDPSHLPGLEPPEGIIPDFDAVSSEYGINIATQGLCLALCTILLAVQLYTKVVCMNGFRREDYAAIFTWLANIIEILYHLCILCTKLAVLFQFLRIFVPSRTRTFYLTWTLVTVNIIINIALALSFAFQCLPRRKIWTPQIDGQCIHLGSAFLVSAATNVITDWAIFLLPLCSIWRLQITAGQKLGVSAVFAVGLFLAEITGGILCVSFPILPQFYRHLNNRFATTLHKSTTRGATPSQGFHSSSANTNSVERKEPYIELEKRRNEQLPPAPGDSSDGESWKRDIERGILDDEYIYKTVTIDQTYRSTK